MRVGWFSDWALAPTGFATVARNVLSRLSKYPDLEVFQLGFGYDIWDDITALDISEEQKIQLMQEARQTRNPWDLHILNKYGFYAQQSLISEKDYGQTDLLQWVKYNKIDALVINFDPWMTAWITTQGLEKDFPCPIIYYQPIDGYCPGEKLPVQLFKDPNGIVTVVKWEDFIVGQNRTVFYGNWAYNLYMKNLDPLEQEIAVPKTSIIPHGIDLETYYPVPKSICRDILGIPQDSFVIGMVGTNQLRKNWPSLAKVVGNLMKKYTNVFFLPWTQFKNKSGSGWDLNTILFPAFLDTRRVFCHKKHQQERPIHSDFMRIIYGAMDVHVQWHRGEGCGLPHLEAQACGRPSLAINYSGIMDYFSDNWLRINTGQFLVGPGNCIMRPEGDEVQLTKKLEYLMAHPEKCASLGRKGVAHAKKYWNWDDIAAQWRALIIQEREQYDRKNTSTSSEE